MLREDIQLRYRGIDILFVLVSASACLYCVPLRYMRSGIEIRPERIAVEASTIQQSIIRHADVGKGGRG